jgi:alpha-1,6-mannosyltransferase
VHDLINYGITDADTIRQHYDHLQFPGVVPRTFIGPLLLAAVVKPILWLWSIIQPAGTIPQQLVVRLVLGVANCWALIWLRKQLAVKFGQSAGLWFGALLCAQFHLIYYASRTLPNFLALPFGTLV